MRPGVVGPRVTPVRARVCVVGLAHPTHVGKTDELALWGTATVSNLNPAICRRATGQSAYLFNRSTE